MKILITGANGFVGRNLVAELKNQGYTDLMLCNRGTTDEQLKSYTIQAEFVFHLAGVNRPKEASEFLIGNQMFTEKLVDLLSLNPVPPPIMYASSIQADLPNLYGESKREAEKIIRTYAMAQNTKSMIYRFPNIFGKWCRPNYNSVIATFCHNISRDIPIQIDNGSVMLTIAYIDDVIKRLISDLLQSKNLTSDKQFYEVYPLYQIQLNQLSELLNSFKKSREDLSIAQLDDELTKKLYSTYLSYLPTNQFSYDLVMHKDQRGSFTEVMRTADRGQVSVNILKPGIVKGNHWHHTKNEKFLVVSGEGVIRLRNILKTEVIEYHVNGEKLEVVDIPVGYTHNIENLGSQDMVTLMWVNEPFDPERPDTYYLNYIPFLLLIVHRLH